MRVPPDHTARTRDGIDVDLGQGELRIDLAARLGMPDVSTIRTRLARRRSAGLRERLAARGPYPAPVR